jgi:hypothetical protein
MIPMPQISMAAGGLMILLGLAGFILTGSTHYTALIPVGFGVVFAICGWLALNPAYLKHCMHLAAVFALLGVVGSVRGLLQLPALIAGQPVARPPAVIAQSIMALLCLGFTGLAIGSFIQARRNRRASANS